MLSILISFLTFVLILVGLFMVLVILMQRASANAGMGSAFGGGVAESAFGAETTNILTRATKWSAVVFFLLSFVLYLLWMKQATLENTVVEEDLPDIPVATATPAEETTSTEVNTTAVSSEEGVEGEVVDPDPES